ncbi:helix-turn-helix domain-containing protein [Luteipulveratus halotolerans]|uniref:helix-turn-helix domain-containing protein n=1 Tax=Luteipulveratus halotolerans TaxID=1631356 RepID=UPI0018D01E12|nr:helix-turn-helix domain-containing protein [Luteipulveratus halotolerans]
MTGALDVPAARLLATTLRAVAHADRLRVISTLHGAPATGSALAVALHVERRQMLAHLRVLRRIGVVNEPDDRGRYALVDGGLDRLARLLAHD